MNLHKIIVFALIAALLAPMLAGPRRVVVAQSSFTPVFESAPCEVELESHVTEGQDIQCGFVTVPENHADLAGDTIQLGVALIPAMVDSPAPEPLVMMQGGPGGSSVDYFAWAMFQPENAGLRKTRDIIMIDQRGTLYSEPFLSCPEYLDVMIETLDDPLTPEESVAVSVDAMAACQTRLIAEGVDLSNYDSLQAAADVPMVVDALGYTGAYNLYGVSYGTMLAQHVMKTNPERLRSVILDSVVPLDINFIPEATRNADRVFRALFAACASDAACNSAYPDLETVFFETVDRLNANPTTLQVSDPDTFEAYELLLDGDVLISMLFLIFYVTWLIPELPATIYEWAADDFWVVEWLLPLFYIDRTSADGVYMSVICAEDADFAMQDSLFPEMYPQLESFALEDPTLSICEIWEVELLDNSVDEPVVSDIPTLVLSGAFDPITPPAFGSAVAAHLGNVHEFVFPWQGHGAVGEPCPVQIMIDFLESPTTAPDASCIDSQTIVWE